MSKSAWLIGPHPGPLPRGEGEDIEVSDRCRGRRVWSQEERFRSFGFAQDDRLAGIQDDRLVGARNDGPTPCPPQPGADKGRSARPRPVGTGCPRCVEEGGGLPFGWAWLVDGGMPAKHPTMGTGSESGTTFERRRVEATPVVSRSCFGGRCLRCLLSCPAGAARRFCFGSVVSSCLLQTRVTKTPGVAFN